LELESRRGTKEIDSPEILFCRTTTAQPWLLCDVSIMILVGCLTPDIDWVQQGVLRRMSATTSGYIDIPQYSSAVVRKTNQPTARQTTIIGVKKHERFCNMLHFLGWVTTWFY
jgi:hypothetical protein